MWYEVGDVVCFIKPKGWDLIGRGINFFQTTAKDETKTQCYHVGMIVEEGNFASAAVISESRHRVINRPLSISTYNREFKIYRLKPSLIGSQKQAIQEEARKWEGRRYGYLKILLHALDWCLGGAYVFRRICLFPNMPFCSYYIGKLFIAAGVDVGWPNPKQLQPDDIMDFFECQKTD